MRRLSHFLRTLGAFVFFAFGGFALSWMVLPFVYFSTRDKDTAHRRCQRSLQLGFRIFSGVLSKLRLLKTNWPPRERITTNTPSVIICNHPTLLDTVLMAMRFNDVICMVKPSYYASPLFFGLARMCGYVPAARPGHIREHQTMLAQVDAKLAAGFNVLAFPETRRSPIGSYLPFRRGPIELAARAGVPIIPVRITCSPRTLAREIPLKELPLVCALYSCEQLPAVTVQVGRTAVRASTCKLENLLQSRPAPSEPGQLESHAHPGRRAQETHRGSPHA
ncbi:MAG: 1-acyl-sn-glycerol-3-phosphate acyltransferase [Nannocystaceae bacterium]|nr:1-acyl-sn-glycerol-3-phosphate acyltransferase [Nannocystaceae bacterium]